MFHTVNAVSPAPLASPIARATGTLTANITAAQPININADAITVISSIVNKQYRRPKLPHRSSFFDLIHSVQRSPKRQEIA